ncbi:hypothetical protein HNR61_009482 [Actinomadura namibiensis]|uniref:Uncharacterized protein n=1 Tax=Actinomadura namibiensis TaxID=182080 RepID=A0A7W3M0U3_ACTNM|nr:hypothetical protein [Actinomadura namibiensis]
MRRSRGCRPAVPGTSSPRSLLAEARETSGATLTELPGRAAAPVESAAYFAVAEMLANIAERSGARRAWIDLHHADGELTVIVGSGTRGTERRLAAFDGTTVVTSPPGGPTVVTMKIPCALSGAGNPPPSGELIRPRNPVPRLRAGQPARGRGPTSVTASARDRMSGFSSSLSQTRAYDSGLMSVTGR